MIPVYNDNDEIIGHVSANTNLDYWDGNNHTCGSVGNHKGLTRLKSGRYVLIHTTQWAGGRDIARVITPEQAVQEILISGNEELLDNYPELMKIYNEMDSEEE